jgi:hypothetical protein
MFRSRRRDIVFPQSEHARLAGILAWAAGEDPRVVAGVLWHDRGYPALDTDGIGEMTPERWAALMRAGFEPETADPVVDHLARMHIHRLTRSAAPQVAAELEPALPASLARTGLTAEEAVAADAVTALYDMVAFDFCLEEPGSGSVSGVAYEIDGRGGITLDPWPLVPAELDGFIVGFLAEGYPELPAPVVVPFAVHTATT